MLMPDQAEQAADVERQQRAEQRSQQPPKDSVVNGSRKLSYCAAEHQIMTISANTNTLTHAIALLLVLARNRPGNHTE